MATPASKVSATVRTITSPEQAAQSFNLTTIEKQANGGVDRVLTDKTITLMQTLLTPLTSVCESSPSFQKVLSSISANQSAQYLLDGKKLFEYQQGIKVLLVSEIQKYHQSSGRFFSSELSESQLRHMENIEYLRNAFFMINQWIGYLKVDNPTMASAYTETIELSPEISKLITTVFLVKNRALTDSYSLEKNISELFPPSARSHKILLANLLEALKKNSFNNINTATRYVESLNGLIEGFTQNKQFKDKNKLLINCMTLFGALCERAGIEANQQDKLRASQSKNKKGSLTTDGQEYDLEINQSDDEASRLLETDSQEEQHTDLPRSTLERENKEKGERTATLLFQSASKKPRRSYLASPGSAHGLSRHDINSLSIATPHTLAEEGVECYEGAERKISSEEFQLLQEQNQSFEQQLQLKAAEVVELSKDLDAVKKKLEIYEPKEGEPGGMSLPLQVKTLEGDLRRAQEELRLKTAGLARAEQENASLQKKYDQVQSAFTSYKVGETQRRAEAVREEIEKINASSEQTRAQIGTLSKTHETTIEALKRQHKEALTIAKQESTALALKIKELQTIQEKQDKALQIEKKKLQEAIETGQKELASLRDEHAKTIRRKEEAFSAERTKFEDEIRNLNQQIKDVQARPRLKPDQVAVSPQSARYAEYVKKAKLGPRANSALGFGT